MESGAREHQAVEQCDRDADRHTLLQAFQHPTANGAVDIQAIFDACVCCRDYVRLTTYVETNVADKCFVDDGIDCCEVVAAAIALACDGSALGFHDRRLRARVPPQKSQFEGILTAAYGRRCPQHDGNLWSPRALVPAAAPCAASAAAHQDGRVVALEAMNGPPVGVINQPLRHLVGAGREQHPQHHIIC